MKFAKELNDIRTKAIKQIADCSTKGSVNITRYFEAKWCGESVALTSVELMSNNTHISCVNFVYGDDEDYVDFFKGNIEESEYIDGDDVTLELLCEIADNI